MRTMQNAYRLPSEKAYSLIALSVDKSLEVHISSTTDRRAACDLTAGFMPLQ